LRHTPLLAAGASANPLRQMIGEPGHLLPD